MASPAPDVLVPEDTHQHLRIVAIFVIFVGSLIGVLLPAAFRSRKEGLGFSFVKQIGSGVVLATGIVHVLPDANAALSDPALGECDSHHALCPSQRVIPHTSVSFNPPGITVRRHVVEEFVYALHRH